MIFYLFSGIFQISFAIWKLIRARELSALPFAILGSLTLMAWAAANFLFYSPFALAWSHLGAFSQGSANLNYFTMISAGYAATYLFASATTPKVSTETTRYRMPSAKGAIIGTSAVILLFSLYHISILDLDVILHNSSYLEMASTKAVSDKTPLAFLAQRIFKLVALVTFVMLAISFTRKIRLATMMLLFPAVWFLLFDIAGHSRFSAVYVLTFGIIYLLTSAKSVSARIVFAASIAFAFLNLVNSLSGRSSGEHGLASLWNYIGYAANSLSSDTMFLVGNILEGAYVQAEMFLYPNLSYPDIYKVLSLSPLPSAIDGFAESARHYTFAFVRFVPASATGEVIRFGMPYLFIYYAVIFIDYYLCIRAGRRGKLVIFSVTFLPFLLGTYLQFTYPVRNVFRFFVLGILIYSFIGIWQLLRPPLVRSFGRKRERRLG